MKKWHGKNYLFLPVTGRRENLVTYITYKRLLQTNEPVNDYAIPLDREVLI